MDTGTEQRTVQAETWKKTGTVWKDRVRGHFARWSPGWVFAVALSVYVASPVMVQSDSIWTIPTAASIWLQGNTNLDEFPEATRRQPHGIEERGGHVYNYFPLGPSLVALPFVAATDLILKAAPIFLPESSEPRRGARTWLTQFHTTGDIDYGCFIATERLIASFFTALAVALVFMAVRRQVSPAASVLVAVAMAFGSSAYSSASRVLWQHGPSMFAISAVIFLLARPKLTRKEAALTGFFVAAAYLFRPTNSVTVLLATAYFFLSCGRQLVAYLLGAGALAIPFCALNLSLYRNVLPSYYLAARLEPGGSHFWEALPGNLVSPARGLFVHSPIFLLSLVGLLRGIARKELLGFEKVFALAVLLHWVVISSFPHWWGGYSVGPRLFSDVVPYLAYFLAKPMEALLSAPRRPRVYAAAAGLLFAASLFIHTRGATSYAVHRWNDGPPSVDAKPARLWDWTGVPFLRRASHG